MNDMTPREEINERIDEILRDLDNLREVAEHDDPGIYYEQQREGLEIERRLHDLIRELEELDEEQAS